MTSLYVIVGVVALFIVLIIMLASKASSLGAKNEEKLLAEDEAKIRKTMAEIDSSPNIDNPDQFL